MHQRAAGKKRWFSAVVGVGVAVLLGAGGCFNERTIVIRPSDRVPIVMAESDSSAAASSTQPTALTTPMTTRQWVDKAHRLLKHLIPRYRAETLTTTTMLRSDGSAIDVFKYFRKKRSHLLSAFTNLRGIHYTAISGSRDYYIEQTAPAWPNFEEIWIPINETFSLCGRLGLARDERGQVQPADCIVIMPGLFGDNGVKRTRDLAIPLRELGYHVLALEIRGYGQVERRYPSVHVTFGVFEADDLMRVNDWLIRQGYVKRVGLIGYCWTANIALLTAWFDGRRPDDPMVPASIGSQFLSPSDQRRFTAGVIAFSPVLRWEELQDELEHPHILAMDPIHGAVQVTVRDRMIRKGYPNPDGNLRVLIEREFSYYDGKPTVDQAHDFLRLLPYKGLPAGDKLESVRMPVLIVNGADDPLIPAQDLADLIAATKNPQVAALILPSGGHVGFGAYAGRYYISMIANFFDPVSGAAVMSQPKAR